MMLIWSLIYEDQFAKCPMGCRILIHYFKKCIKRLMHKLFDGEKKIMKTQLPTIKPLFNLLSKYLRK